MTARCSAISSGSCPVGLIAARNCTAVDTAYAKGPDGVGKRIRDKITVEQMLRG